MKHSIYLFLGLFIFVPLTQAAVNTHCSGDDAGFSLYDKGRSLSGVKQQDQDGLNTCYANVVSLMLKSENPKLPTPSYLDLASYNNNEDSEYEFEIGDACFLHDKIKNTNKEFCETGIIENSPLGVQDTILKNLYNAINIHGLGKSELERLLAKYEKNKNQSVQVQEGLCNSEAEKDMMAAFRALASLGKTTEQMHQYMVDKNGKILRQIIENNCPKKNKYNFSNNCGEISIEAGIEKLTKVEDFEYYKEFMADIDNATKGDKVSIDLFASNFVEKIKRLESNQETIYHAYVLKGFAVDVLRPYLEGSITTDPTKAKVIAAAKENFEKKKSDYLRSGKHIMSTLSQGKALSMSLCGNHFIDKEKYLYEGCINHSVAVTGYRCVGGRLKLELANSWGIQCNDSPNQKQMFNCERDKSGMTNGRAWVDFDFLTDQGTIIRNY